MLRSSSHAFMEETTKSCFSAALNEHPDDDAVGKRKMGGDGSRREGGREGGEPVGACQKVSVAKPLVSARVVMYALKGSRRLQITFTG